MLEAYYRLRHRLICRINRKENLVRDGLEQLFILCPDSNEYKLILSFIDELFIEIRKSENLLKYIERKRKREEEEEEMYEVD